jgi:hypothetical protein
VDLKNHIRVVDVTFHQDATEITQDTAKGILRGVLNGTQDTTKIKQLMGALEGNDT